MSSTSSKTSVPPAARGAVRKRPPAALAGPAAGGGAEQARGRGGDAPVETIAVGRILGPHGLRGEVAVEVLADAPRRFDPGSSLRLVRARAPEMTLVVAARRAAGAPGRPAGG